jgi:hypothetical protein
LKSYRLSVVKGDRYAGLWPRERFAHHGISYQVSDKVKSDLYLNLLPLLNSNRVELLDHNKCLTQLAGLERRTSRGGKDSIDHAPGARDDIANALAGACVCALAASQIEDIPTVAPIFVELGWSPPDGWSSGAFP